jgi:hypothetical protein
MKTFAIMLLMLCSFSFLKVQTMVVETADGMESYEVGEIKGMSAFNQNQFTIWLNIENLPIASLYSSIYNGKATESHEENYSYKVYHVCRATVLSNNEYKIYSNSIDFTFYSNLVKSSAGTESYGSLQFDENTNLISTMYITTRGSGVFGNMPNPTFVDGNLEVELINIPFKFNSLGHGKAIIQGNDIPKVIKRLMHIERKWGKDFNYKSQIEFLRILETQVNDSSTLTIDLLY